MSVWVAECASELARELASELASGLSSGLASGKVSERGRWLQDGGCRPMGALRARRRGLPSLPALEGLGSVFRGGYRCETLHPNPLSLILNP